MWSIGSVGVGSMDECYMLMEDVNYEWNSRCVDGCIYWLVVSVMVGWVG